MKPHLRVSRILRSILRPSEIPIALAFSEFCDADGICWPKKSTVASLAQVGEKRVQVFLREHESWVERERIGNSWQYRFRWDDLPLRDTGMLDSKGESPLIHPPSRMVVDDQSDVTVYTKTGRGRPVADQVRMVVDDQSPAGSVLPSIRRLVVDDHSQGGMNQERMVADDQSEWSSTTSRNGRGRPVTKKQPQRTTPRNNSKKPHPMCALSMQQAAASIEESESHQTSDARSVASEPAGAGKPALTPSVPLFDSGSKTLRELGVGTQASNKLEAVGVVTVEQASVLTPSELRKRPGIGPGTVEAIRIALSKVDRTLAPEAPKPKPKSADPRLKIAGDLWKDTFCRLTGQGFYPWDWKSDRVKLLRAVEASRIPVTADDQHERVRRLELAFESYIRAALDGKAFPYGSPTVDGFSKDLSGWLQGQKTNLRRSAASGGASDWLDPELPERMSQRRPEDHPLFGWIHPTPSDEG